MGIPSLSFHYDLICPRFLRLSQENALSDVKGQLILGHSSGA